LYFSKVEEKRGRIGCHIDLISQKGQRESEAGSATFFTADFESDRLTVTPSSRRHLSSELFKQAAAYVRSQGHRVILSGIGGEQPTGGGVPTPTPELQNLLRRARFVTFIRQLNAWAAKMKKPRLPLLLDACRAFWPLALHSVPEDFCLPAWLHPSFVRRNHDALHRCPFRTKLFGPLPSFQRHLHLLDSERRLFAYFDLCPELLHENRYPFLDRDLREFAYAIPWEQIVRVGQRRSLMKRALSGILPDELLNRKQKSFGVQERRDPSKELPSSAEIGHYMISASLGIIETTRFLEDLQKARRNDQILLKTLKRTLLLEAWLRNLTIHGILADPGRTKTQNSRSYRNAREFRRSPQSKSSAS
jgi:asparagine synthase (glutamine-hydrolysing)